MEMESIKFSKWGNSLAVRFPSQLTRRMGIGEGSYAHWRIQDGGIFIQPIRQETKGQSLEEALRNPKPLEELVSGPPAPQHSQEEWKAIVRRVQDRFTDMPKSDHEMDDFLAWRKTQWDS